MPNTSNWTDRGPFDLSAGDDKTIYLEFRFQGTDGNDISFYLDDVVIK